MSEQAFQSQSEFSQQQMWYSGTVTNQKIVTTSQTENTISGVSFLRLLEHQYGIYASLRLVWLLFSSTQQSMSSPEEKAASPP